MIFLRRIRLDLLQFHKLFFLHPKISDFKIVVMRLSSTSSGFTLNRIRANPSSPGNPICSHYTLKSAESQEAELTVQLQSKKLSSPGKLLTFLSKMDMTRLDTSSLTIVIQQMSKIVEATLRLEKKWTGLKKVEKEMWTNLFQQESLHGLFLSDPSLLLHILKISHLIKIDHSHPIFSSSLQTLLVPLNGNELSARQIVQLWDILNKITDRLYPQPELTELNQILPDRFVEKLVLGPIVQSLPSKDLEKESDEMRERFRQFLTINDLAELEDTEAYVAVKLLNILVNSSPSMGKMPGFSKLVYLLFTQQGDKNNRYMWEEMAFNCARRCAYGRHLEPEHKMFYNIPFFDGYFDFSNDTVDAITDLGHLNEDYVNNIVSREINKECYQYDSETLLSFTHMFGTLGEPPTNWIYKPGDNLKYFHDNAYKTVIGPKDNLRLTLDLLCMDVPPVLQYVQRIFGLKKSTKDLSKWKRPPMKYCGLSRDVDYGPLPLHLVLSTLLERFRHQKDFKKWLPSHELLRDLGELGKEQAKVEAWNYPLESRLHKMVEGKRIRLETGVWYKGFNIDHCLIMDMQENPFVTTEDYDLESLANWREKGVIVLKVHPPHHYLSIWPYKLRGMYRLESDILQKSLSSRLLRAYAHQVETVVVDVDLLHFDAAQLFHLIPQLDENSFKYKSNL